LASRFAFAVGFAPEGPGLIEQLARHLEAGADGAFVSQECFDGCGEQFHLLDCLASATWLAEISALLQSQITFARPIQDSGQFCEQPSGESRVLLAIERSLEDQRDETSGECAGAIGQSRQLVC